MRASQHPPFTLAVWKIQYQVSAPRSLKIATIVCTCAVSKKATTMLQYKIFPAHKASKQPSINKFLSSTEVVVTQYLQSIRMLSPASNLAFDLLFVPQKVLEGVRHLILTETTWSSCSLSSSQHSCRDCPSIQRPDYLVHVMTMLVFDQVASLPIAFAFWLSLR